MRLLLTTTLALCIFLQGCAGFQTSGPPRVKPERVQFSNPTKPNVFATWRIAAHPHQEEPYLAGFKQALWDSNCCIFSAGPAAEITIEAVADESKASSVAQIFSVVTIASLYTIPSWTTQAEHFSVTVKSAKQTRVYELKAATKLVQWWPMLFFYPFFTPEDEVKSMRMNMYKTLILKMKEDGFLNN